MNKHNKDNQRADISNGNINQKFDGLLQHHVRRAPERRLGKLSTMARYCYKKILAGVDPSVVYKQVATSAEDKHALI
jgi:hypothetical protein